MRWCLVGRFLIESPVEFQAMQHKLASLWRMGIYMYVKEIEPNRYIFQFYHKIDIKCVIERSPWPIGWFQLHFERSWLMIGISIDITKSGYVLISIDDGNCGCDTFFYFWNIVTECIMMTQNMYEISSDQMLGAKKVNHLVFTL